MHTPLFEACFRNLVKTIRQADLSNTHDTSAKLKCQPIPIHTEESNIENQIGVSAGKLFGYVTGI